jgi:SAM-dependent methyltransferase
MNKGLALVQGILPLAPYPYRGSHGPCMLCGSVERLPLASHDRRLKRLTSVVCAGCGLIRTDPMPSEAELGEYYRSLYRLDYQLVGDKPPRRHITRTTAEAARRRALLNLPAGATVLDYGSGSGEFLAEGMRAGWTMLGVEPGEAYAAHARTTHGATVLPALPDDAGPFDAITSHHVFEHLRDPVAVLTMLVARLKPDGILYLSVPDLGPSTKPAFERLHFAHVHGFVPATLDLLAAKCGLVLDTRFERHGTTAVYCQGEADFRPDAETARAVVAGFNMVSPATYVLTLGFVAPALKRWRRDIRDTFGK